MDRAIKTWLLEQNINNHHDPTQLAKRLHLSYTIYGCLLLLPYGAFEIHEWQQIRAQCNIDFESLYKLIATHLKVTHIAITEPIPLYNYDETYNVLRAPSKFTPLYGDFGPTTCSSPPTQQDFDMAFWVTAKQNGIYQTWAPRWTMFSRGNTSEKARLLTLPSVKEAVENGKVDRRGCAAVDLYAGIGYFAFSYLKAGVSQVMCWDINPWSIKGLKRGAIANKWTMAMWSNEDGLSAPPTDLETRLLVFNEANDLASIRVQQLKGELPPVRHVNCGLLPTSQGSWQTALAVLDEDMGGWVHVHENFAVKEIGEKAKEVQAAFQHMMSAIPQRTVELEHINRLKSYAPGVIHCVLDIYIPPRNPG